MVELTNSRLRPKRADRIVVVDHGKIVEIGTHDQLLANRGRFAEMYETWSRRHDTQTHQPAEALD